MAPGMETQEFNDPLGVPALLVILSRGPADAQHLLQPGTASLEIAPGQHVVQHAHPLEQGDVLEGTGNATLRRLVRTHAAAGLAGVADRAALRLVDTVNHVE